LNQVITSNEILILIDDENTTNIPVVSIEENHTDEISPPGNNYLVYLLYLDMIQFDHEVPSFPLDDIEGI
jgi:hypothetical protein